ncbi:MAG: 16S rRNA (cytidine(1402)-2'-O)-methyltransferase [Pseudomonadota bacterium]
MSEFHPDPGLHIVSTPIGRARDITLHALDLLQTVDLLVAEDTRVLRKLLTLHGVALGDRKLISHHDHSKDRDLRPIREVLETGGAVAYCSDAGTPMVSDPGHSLIQLALELDVPIHSAPGPSAALAALVISGLPSDRFQFEGFLPTKSGARRVALERIANADQTSLFYETPKRLKASLSDIAVVLDGERQIVLCRELTKRHEQVVRGTIAEVSDGISNGAIDVPEKGELVILIGPASIEVVDDGAIKEALKDLMDNLGVKKAANQVAADLNISKGRAYQLALDIKNGHSED